MLPQAHEPSARLGTELDVSGPGENVPAVFVPETPVRPVNEGLCV